VEAGSETERPPRAARQPATTELDAATAVAQEADGLYSATIDTDWGIPTGGPNGGYLAAIATRALQAHVDPTRARQLRSLTCHYLRPPGDGRAELAVETLRSGRRFSTARLTMTQGGKLMVTALAAFSLPELPSVATWSPALPAVLPAPPRDAERLPPGEYTADSGTWLATPPEMPPIVQRVKLAPRLGTHPFAGRALAEGETPETGGWIELPEPRPVDAVYIALLTDIWWPPALEPLTTLAVAPTIDLTIHVRAPLPPEGLPDQPVLGVFRSGAALGGMMEEDGALFLADGTLLAHSRQLALLAPLVTG
jgi:acyl-CoA thioesterase